MAVANDELIKVDSLEVALNIAYEIGAPIVGYKVDEGKGLALYAGLSDGVIEFREEDYNDRDFIEALVSQFLASKDCTKLLEKVSKPKVKSSKRGEFVVSYDSFIVPKFDSGTARKEIVVVKPCWKFIDLSKKK